MGLPMPLIQSQYAAALGILLGPCRSERRAVSSADRRLHRKRLARRTAPGPDFPRLCFVHLRLRGKDHPPFARNEVVAYTSNQQAEAAYGKDCQIRHHTYSTI